MKRHPHEKLIKEWLDDTSKKIQMLTHGSVWYPAKLEELAEDYSGDYEFRIKPSDPYAELRKAQEEGKRVVWQSGSGEWEDNSAGGYWEFTYTPDRYKIVDYDKEVDISINPQAKGFGIVNIRMKKSGITGKITSEVIE